MIYKLSDIADFNARTLKATDNINKILYLDTSSIIDNEIFELQELNISDAPSRAQRRVKDNTIIISMVRPNMRHFGILKNPDDNLIISTGFCTIDIKDNSVIDSQFLYYLLSQQSVVNYLQAIAQNAVSAYPSINPSDIMNLCFDFPTIKKQRDLSSVLSDIDEKVQLNKSINRNLESLAKLIYDYWFVQFDFPDENGRPYKSSGGKMMWNEKLKREIPEGFEVIPLRKFIKLEDYKRVPLSNVQRLSMHGIYPYYGATGIMDYVTDFIFDGDYVLLAEDGSTSDVHGFPIVQYIWGKNWVNNHAHIISHTQKEYLPFIYHMLKTIPAKKIETGSIQKKISQENLLGYNVALPQDDLIKGYCDIIIPLWDYRKKKIEENNLLTKLRDELLPLLMNGQVTVKEYL
ncbi:MAG: restriction endonuclease subunit S [Prevotella sp.]|nr:restriction endonuclease subunit S [Prevotella sp.]